MMKKTERIGILLFRYIRKELSREEEKELTSWRYASAAHEKLFQEKTDRTRILADLAAYLEERDRVFQQIGGRYSGVRENRFNNRRRQVRRNLGMAAVLVVVLISGLIFRFSRQRMASDIQPGHNQAMLVSLDGMARSLDDFHRGFLLANAGIQIEKKGNGDLLYIAPNDTMAGKEQYIMLYTLRGGQFSLKLPDGTVVWLNAQSSIKFPANFSHDSVTVTIEGEAYFEMAGNDKPRLKIIAGPTKTEAPGAHVNIFSYPDEPAAITLLEGKAVTRIHTGLTDQEPKTMMLLQDEEVNWIKTPKGVFLKQGFTRPENIREIADWKDGSHSFRNADFQTIMLAISRWYDVDLIYKGVIPGQKFSLRLPRSASLYQVLRELEKQGGHFQVQGRTITVSQ